MNLSFWLREYLKHGKEPDSTFHGQNLSRKFGYPEKRRKR
jgi:hypothetical protein